ncbi:Glutamate racemase 1 [Enhygromyxa salina]|uniref:Glutamate racemase n=1 Tax=Enhygromyxa salina TaxID=215803 RepID=A0A2S9XHN1_9BACT|nr:glutamate racemase [Enhygromyxa salina]PRP92372.1 Glutamate racemase 1 [Enhygromyxa salina]
MAGHSASPIGVFDSGVGGLTVLAALRERLPDERFLYLGDTARLPYGSKSPQTVRRYARQAAGKLVERGVKLLVVACNTASAVAVEDLREAFAPLPVIGVVEAGARAACVATQTGHVLVTGTEGTVSGGAYERAMLALRPELSVDAVACPMFVALAEEGWTEGPIPEAVARRYLELELAGPERTRVDTLVLGCTHFPVLRAVLERVCGPGVALVDSARTTATEVAELLEQGGLAGPSPVRPRGPGESVRFLATDAPERFARVGAVFLACAISLDDIELVDL